MITTDEAPSSGEYADSSSCCGQPRFPSLPAPAGLPRRCRRKAAARSARCCSRRSSKAATINQESFNHFSLLRTFEDFFGVKHLGYAAGAHVGSLEPSLFLAKAQRGK